MDPVTHPAQIMAVYRRSPHVHPYGIADVQQLWDTSRWWRRGDAVVGLLRLGGGDVVYAVADTTDVARSTLGLLGHLSDILPDHLVITGPTGLSEVLTGAGYDADWTDAYDKLHLPADVTLPPASGVTEVLRRRHHDEVVALIATDPDAGDFFHAELLDTGHYVGRRLAGALVAVAGVHVVDPVNRIAAVGNVATHPAHRRKGHGRAVVVDLLHRLRDEVDVIGLNVRHRTDPARAMYRAIGFVHAVTYEEAEVTWPRTGRAGDDDAAGDPRDSVRPRAGGRRLTADG
ncbi:MAG TPA: GNAT family N-acetyltransferase [Euzebya sp.]|nr:GNAT family N-acetyltransferase [Euzebya sp.]